MWTSKLKDSTLVRDTCWVGGKWIGADNGETLVVLNPSTGEELGKVPKMRGTETKRAIECASEAFVKWSKLVAKERSAILRKWFDLINQNVEDLAVILTAEMGKPLEEARGEVGFGASFVEWYAEEAKRVYGTTLPEFESDKRLLAIKQPIGVVGAITPWNFPNAMITRKIAPALAVGCTVVVKPSEETPLSAIALAVLAERAGIPAGVFNIVLGEVTEIGGEMTANPIVRKISFTGSTPVGRLLMSQSSNTVKKMSLELGGNAPFIVFEDADVDGAVDALMAGKFTNAGQTCVSPNRIFVQSSIYDQFSQKVVKKVEALKVGDGFSEGVQIGPLINDKAVAKCENLVTDAKENGAKVLCGGGKSKGRFVEPTVLVNMNDKMMIFTNEIFGPVIALFRFDTEEEVVGRANDTVHGLGSYFFTRNFSRTWRVAEQIESGCVSVNTTNFVTEHIPFGGVKQSGIGREGSKFGLDDFLEIKYICVSGI